MKYTYIILFLALSLLIPTTGSTQSKISQFDHSHKKWNEVLKSYVVVDAHKASVRYNKLKSSPNLLKEYLESISAVSMEQYKSFTKDEQLSFLINAYNAFTLELIIRHYPVKSIKEIASWYSSPWKIKFAKLLGEERTLDNIEHEMIRKWFNEPRIHFALVCAAKSCPPLRNEPYRASELQTQLHDAANNFLTDKERNYFDPAVNSLYISSIFKWYGADFNAHYGSVEQYISKFYPNLPSKVKVIFLSYEWSLNDATN